MASNTSSEEVVIPVEPVTATDTTDASNADIPDYLKMSAMEHDQAVEHMKQDIEKEVSKQHLVGDIEPTSVLKTVYANDDSVYQAKIQEIEKNYSKIRRIRQDGNCFFRSFGFSLMEQLLANKSEIDKIKPSLTAVKTDLIGKFGYPDMTVEDFYDNFIEVLDKLKEEETDIEYLLKTYQDSGLSDYMVCFMRLIVSVQLQRNAEFYLNFISSKYPTIKSFLSEEVEPMYVESDHLHIDGLSTCLNIRIIVQYMDRGMKVQEHKFQEGSPINVTINLLYRPGHYDILYA
ncbi:Ubiquitin thioesterase OTUB1-like [Oopsacas minuta]|uniref:Ubiquitin thioesterase n=1 Tax=Oopsacas minuta TaxID=111878 RepID=A0AAV7K8S5_9METZ|nr:Ubiquitin thioesterase OTUB1-like [Oopsacas minuta]